MGSLTHNLNGKNKLIFHVCKKAIIFDYFEIIPPSIMRWTKLNTTQHGILNIGNSIPKI